MPGPGLISQDELGKEGRSLSWFFRNFEEMRVALAASGPHLPPSCYSSGPSPKRLIVELSHQRKLYFVPQRPNGASVKWLFMVSNEHFLGVINLYAKVTLGPQMAAQTVLAWVGAGAGVKLGQAAVRLRPPTGPPETSVPLFLLLCDSHPSPTGGALCSPGPDGPLCSDLKADALSERQDALVFLRLEPPRLVKISTETEVSFGVRQAGVQNHSTGQ